jgi:hypothetical protein
VGSSRRRSGGRWQWRWTFRRRTVVGMSYWNKTTATFRQCFVTFNVQVLHALRRSTKIVLCSENTCTHLVFGRIEISPLPIRSANRRNAFEIRRPVGFQNALYVGSTSLPVAILVVGLVRARARR